MLKDIKIGNKKIGPTHDPFIIAEMSGNHNRSLDRALQIVKEAAKNGATGLKLQTLRPETITLKSNKSDFLINDGKSLWNGRTLYDLYEEAYTPWEWHEPIFKLCKKLGLMAFSTPFDLKAVDFLEKLNVPAYKIASFESTDYELIKKVASTGKPMIISTGMCNLADMEMIVNTSREYGCKDIVLLKCTSSYPASPKNSNLNTIPHMRKIFNTQVGLSDHTLGIGVAVASIALGATVIEKHFTLNRSDGGLDSVFSIEPHELKLLVEEANKARQALGTVSFGVNKSEEKSLKYKRSIYITENMKKGEKFNKKNLKIIRPGFGLEPKNLEIFMGKRVNKKLTRGTPLSWEYIG